MADEFNLWGLRVQNLGWHEFSHKIRAKIEKQESQWIVTLNIDILRQVENSSNELVRTQIIENATVCLDGLPLVLFSRILGQKHQQRITGMDLIIEIASHCRDLNFPVFLIGGPENTSTRASQKLHEKFPGLQIIPFDIPYLDNPQILKFLSDMISNKQAGFFFIGLGSIKSEKLITEMIKSYPSLSFIGCGGALSVLSGDIRRAPRIIQNLGAEWIWRLSNEPRRLYKRYLIQDLPFALKLFIRAIRTRVRTYLESLNL